MNWYIIFENFKTLKFMFIGSSRVTIELTPSNPIFSAYQWIILQSSKIKKNTFGKQETQFGNNYFEMLVTTIFPK